MRTTDWLKPFRSIRTHSFGKRPRSRASVYRSFGTARRQACFSVEAARCEQLEERLLLAAVIDAHADCHHEVDSDPGLHGDVANYLPPQVRLQATGQFLTNANVGEPFQIAQSYLASHVAELGLQPADLEEFIVSSQYTDQRSGTTHIYLRQTFGGLEVMNADLSIHVTARGEIISVSSSFIGSPQVVGGETPHFVIGAPQAFAEFSDDMGLGLLVAPQIVSINSESPDLETVLSASGVALEDVQAKLVYVPTADGLELAWRLNVQTLDQAHWYDAFVDADSGESIYVDDAIGHASYRVFAAPLQSPNDGPRTLVTDTHDLIASPFGWHDTNGVAGAEFTDTQGNNAVAQDDVDANDVGGFRPDGGAGLVFDFPHDVAQDPALFPSAAITNAFYWVNTLHDIHYQYGFTEAAGNFQSNNYGKGGLGNDPVLIDVHDGGGGGAAFVSPKDGQSPRMTLTIRAAPSRDNAIDNDIIIHEYGHGISERLTGGPANNQGLNATQSRGMGEGWSDWWAIMLTQVPSDAKLDSYPIGAFLVNDPGGIRRFPYSFDMAINPLTYADYNNASTRSSQHAIGEIWASALWDMNWLLVEKHGFSSDFYHGTGGNNLALQLVMDGLKLQGTNPSLLDSRDAILAADFALTGGQNHAEIWTAFARRGMGFSANDGGSASSTSVTEAFDIPGTISGTVYRDDDADGTRDAGEPGLSGWSVYRDLNNNGVQDVASLTTLNSTDTPRTITDPNIKSPIVISGLSGVIVDINITVNISHLAVGELNLALLPPTGTPVILTQFLGGTGDNFTNTVFDDEAATYVTSASAPFTGSFKPYFSLSQLDGVTPNGTWQLRIDDIASGNMGTLLSWSIQVSYGNPDPTTVTDANGNYTFFSSGNGTHHVREIVQPGFTQTAPASGVNDIVISGGVPVVGQNFGNRTAASVSNSSTTEDTLSSAIVISPPAGLAITHFKISGIANGTLFKNNGVTSISNGDFLTVADAAAGVKFLPSLNSNAAGQFDVELSQNGTTVLAVSSKASGTVTITPVGDTPTVANITTLQNTLTGPIVINRHVADGAEVTHFKISGISGGTLFKNNGTTQIFNSNFITFAEAQAGVKFRPTANSTATGTFDVESSQNGSTVAAQSGKATSTINVTPIGFSIVESSGSTSVTEAGSTDTFTVVLITQPVSNVVLSVVSGDPTEATAVPATLTFTSANWNVPQTATVTGVDDLLDDGDIVSTVTISVVDGSSDDAYDPLLDKTVSVTTTDDDVATLTVNVFAASVAENAGAAATTVTITRNTSTTNALVVNLSSNDTSEATVPATATILAGQSSVTVNLAAIDDAIVDGTQTATISASASGFTGGSDVLDVTDNDSPTLTLNVVAASVAENSSAAATTVVVSRNTDTTNALIVNLSSSDTTEATVPATATILAGQVSVTVNLDAVDDAILDGPQAVTITAASAGFANGSDLVIVTDNEVPALTLVIAAASVAENAGLASTTLTITRNSNTTNALIVSLSSSDISEATVPATATILAGQASVIVNLNSVDDATVDGTQSVTITASASGFTSGNDTLDVTDNDVPTLTLNVVAASVAENSGAAATTVIISRNTNTSNAVVVSLSSSDTTEATVPAMATILAGQVSVTVNLGAVDDAILDGTQSVTITASASGFLDGVDTLEVTDNEVPSLTIDVAATSVAENSGAASTSLTITRIADTTNDLIVNLSSNDTSEATVPATATILAGQSSVTVNVDAVDDAFVDGSQVVTISVSAPGFVGANGILTVTDNDVPTLSVDIAAAAVAENSGSAASTVTITRNTSTTNALVVNLASSDTSEATVQATATIPAGQASVTVNLNAIDDSIVDGTQSVTITASAPGFTSGTDSLEVTDNDSPTLTVNVVALSIGENFGAAATTVTVTRNTPTGSELIVNLVSSDTSEATVPATATILAGQSSVTVNLNAVDDSIVDGTQIVTITGSAAGFANGSDSLNVTDNDTLTLVVIVAAASVAENSGNAATTVTVSRNTLTDTELVVTLSSSDIGEATVPATAVIPVGQASVTVNLNAIDEQIADGTRTVTIVASAAGFIGGSDTLDVTDNDVPTLTISSPDSVVEGGSIQATISRNTLGLVAVVVTLQNSNAADLIVLQEITFPIGVTSKGIILVGVDDGLVDGNSVATLTAVSSGFLTASKTLTIVDNDVPTLSMSVDAAQFDESGQATMTVFRNTPTSSPLTVQFGNSNSSAVTVPASVEIPSGQISQSFVISGVDDQLVDGTQLATITASAPSFVSSSQTVRVTDNDMPALSITFSPGTIVEAGGVATATVTRNNNPSAALTVQVSSPSNRVQVPSSVTFAAGSTSAVFAVTGVNDSVLNAASAASALVLVSASGLSSGSATLTVLDDEANATPTLNEIANVIVATPNVTQFVSLSGITPGNAEIQNVRVSAVSSNSAIVALVNANYSGGEVGSLTFTPTSNSATNLTLITVTVEDDGVDGNFATPGDNRSISRQFFVAVQSNLTIDTASINPTATNFELRRAGVLLELVLDSQVTSSIHYDSVGTISLLGNAANNRLHVNFDAGNPIPVGGLNYSGGSQPNVGLDKLELSGATVGQIVHNFQTFDSGSIAIDGSRLTYDGLRPEVDSLGAQVRTFEFGSANDVIRLGDDGVSGNGLARISRMGTIESLDFAMPTEVLIVDAGAGNDRVTISNLESNSARLAVQGNSGDDFIEGSDADETLMGGSGKDTIKGGAGNDVLLGAGSSGDELSGGLGNDYIDGGSGLDFVFDEGDVDFVLTTTSLSGLGNDTLVEIERANLIGGESANRIDASGFLTGFGVSLVGNGGDDVLIGSVAGDTLIGGAGNDIARGLLGNDGILGQAGADQLFGDEGDDYIRAGGGSNDVVSGGAGHDFLDGGTGGDRLVEVGDVDFTIVGTQAVANMTGLGNDRVLNIEIVLLTGGESANRFDLSRFDAVWTILVGLGGDDHIIGSPGADLVEAGSGNDFVSGGLGDDTIKGQDGSDVLLGGDGNDLLNGGTGNDQLYGGAGDDRLSGYSGNDFLLGDLGDDILIGGDDDDTLFGSGGSDIVIGSAGNDYVRGQGSNNDTVVGGSGNGSADAGDQFVLNPPIAGGDLMSEIDETFKFSASWIDEI